MILFVVLALLIFVYFLFGDDKKRYQWNESYRADSRQPYGTLFIQQLLEAYRPGGTVVVNKKPLWILLEEIKEPAYTDYVFVGQSIFLDPESHAAIVRFMDKGGDVFIGALSPPDNILGSVYHQECDSPVLFEDNFSDSVRLNFFHPQLRSDEPPEYAFRFGSEDQAYYWNYFTPDIFCDSTMAVVPLGYQQDGRVNFIKISAGKGNLYLHSNPLVFTNYFLTEPAKLRYASAVFSHLEGRNIIWDEYSKIPFMGNNNPYNSPLYYIMAQPSLKYAWWLLLLTVFLYIFFAAKRKQKIIPVMDPKTNTSLEFVRLISRLHYKNGNHLDMAHKKMRYFLYFVRSKYGIHAERFKEEQIRRLAEKSRVRFAEVESIFLQYYLIEERFKNNIEANRLVDLYDAIDNFYKQCK